MSKTGVPHLFRLIKSLTPNEKGYIKKIAALKGEKKAHFIHLLEAIDEQDTYNEEALLRREPFRRHLPRMKNYLHAKILAALDQYHASRNTDMQVRSALNQVTILFSKGFYDRCRAELTKAKALCRRYEKLLLLLEVLEWERLLIREKLLMSSLQQLQEEEKAALQQVSELCFYRNAYDTVSSLYSHTFCIRTPAEHESYRAITGSERFTAPSPGLPLHAKILCCKTLAKYYAALDERASYLQVAQQAAGLYRQNAWLIAEDVHGYIRVLNNLLATLAEHKEVQRFDDVIEELRRLPQEYPTADRGNLEAIVAIRVLLRLFYRDFSDGDFEKALQRVPEIEQKLRMQEDLLSLPHRYIFYYSIAYLFFIHGNYEAALARTQILLNGEVNGETVTYACYAKLLLLLIHYEMGNYDLLEYLVASVRKFLVKFNKLYAPERIVTELLRKKLSAPLSSAEKTIVFRELQSALEQTGDLLLRRNYEYFDMVGWAQSKTESRPFAAVLAERLKKA